MGNDIPLQDREIRLLFLLHNDCGAEDIKYTLLRTTIDRAPPYEALSYAWGEDLCQITPQNGTATTLTTNLYQALRYLQRPYAARVLWIDALCINQEDGAERSKQAQLMGQIFATAWRVLIWLGEADDKLSHSFTILKRGYQAAAAEDGHSSSSTPVSLTAEEKGSIMQLIDRPYFERTWVLQETIVAKTALVMWSRFHMPFETLMAACEVLDLNESRWSHFNFACQTITTFGSLRRVFQGLTADRTALGLTQLLLHTMGNRATDPRDKVFALFGIVNEAHDITPARPDYSRTVEEVYISVARFLVGDDHSLQILSAVQHGCTRSSLPSWVPDWRIEWPIRLLDAAQEYLDFRAHGEHQTYPVIRCTTAVLLPTGLAMTDFIHQRKRMSKLRGFEQYLQAFFLLEHNQKRSSQKQDTHSTYAGSQHPTSQLHHQRKWWMRSSLSFHYGQGKGKFLLPKWGFWALGLLR